MEINNIEIKGTLIKTNDIIPMYINNVIESGVFASYGHIETFIPIKLLRYGFITNIFNEYRTGKQVFVRVLKITEHDGHITLEASGKHAQIDPWSELGIVSNLEVEEVLAGKVMEVKDYGVFINLFDGVDILVRPLSKKAYNYEPTNIGDIVDIKITEINKEDQKISGKLHKVKRYRTHY